MHKLPSHTINVRGKLIDLQQPQVMGILNITPDSFYEGSRKQTDADILARVDEILTQGGTMIDVGAYSSRSGADDVSIEEEKRRLGQGLELIRRHHPEAIVSIDTFRADVAEWCVRNYEADIINDISGGELDSRMLETVAQLNVPYILMHMKGTPQNMQDQPHYDDLMGEMMQYFAAKVNRLHEMGLNDIILDPGFGFAKTLDHNYQLMARMDELHALGLPLLVGISRKSMIYRLLGTTPHEALNGTSVLNTMALDRGASILRVHDVRECVEVVKIWQATQKGYTSKD